MPGSRVCFILRGYAKGISIHRGAPAKKNLHGEISIHLSTPVTLSQIWNGQNLAAEIH